MNSVLPFLFSATLLGLLPIRVEATEPLESLATRVHQIVEAQGDSCVALHDVPTGKWTSGVIISERGYVLTVAHGFGDGTSQISAHLADGREVEASLIARDVERDLALLKFDDYQPSPEMVASLPDLSELHRVAPVTGGEPLIVVGHPLGQVARRGRSSRLSFLACRSIRSGDLLTTAKLTAGDSGGGLFDLNGRLVAIHRAADRAGGYSAHVPICAARDLLARVSGKGAR